MVAKEIVANDRTFLLRKFPMNFDELVVIFTRTPLVSIEKIASVKALFKTLMTAQLVLDTRVQILYTSKSTIEKVEKTWEILLEIL